MLNAYALTTEQRVADYMGLGTLVSGSAKHTKVQRLINSVTDWIEKYCGRRFKLTTYTDQQFDGQGGNKIVLPNYPIGTLTSLSFRSSGLNEDDWETIASNLYHVDLNTGIITGTGSGKLSSGYLFAQGKYNMKATYTAGYNFDNTSTFLSDVGAADLEYICWKLVATAYEKKGAVGIQSERIGDYSVTYAKTAFENEEVKDILDKYASISVSGYDLGISV